MIERPAGLWIRKGPGSGALDRTISDVPFKTVYEPQTLPDSTFRRPAISVYARHSP